MDGLESARATLGVLLRRDIFGQCSGSVGVLIIMTMIKAGKMERFSLLEASFHSRVLLCIKDTLRDGSKPRRER